MKKTIFTLAATAFFAAILLAGCNSSWKKIENAEDKVKDSKEAVIDAKIDLNQARKDSLAEFQQFKTAYQNEISANEKTIAGLKLSYAGATRENKAIYDKKLAGLEKKNNDMKIKLAEYKGGGTDQWQTFKMEFKSDMEQLGKAFSDFTVSNKNL